MKNISRQSSLVLLIVVSCLLLLMGCNSSAAGAPADPQTNLDPTAVSLEQAITSGKPTLAEFGRGVCVPCKEMRPILEELAVEYRGRLNVVIVEVDEHLDLVNQYQIMMIPTQILFDGNGQKILAHIGFWPKEQIVSQIDTLGID